MSYIYIWRYGLPWHKVLNALVAELNIHKLKNQRRCIDSLYLCVFLNPLKSELFTKQACRDAVVVYSLFFSPTIYPSLY